jgi:hypothetical protein
LDQIGPPKPVPRLPNTREQREKQGTKTAQAAFVRREVLRNLEKRMKTLVFAAAASFAVGCVGTFGANAMMPTSSAGVRLAHEATVNSALVHCRPYRHWHPWGYGTGCHGGGVSVEIERHHRGGVRVEERERSSIHSRTTTRTESSVRGSTGTKTETETKSGTTGQSTTKSRVNTGGDAGGSIGGGTGGSSGASGGTSGGQSGQKQ